MRICLLLTLCVLLLARCTHAPKQTLPWRWSFIAVKMYNENGFLDSINNNTGNDNEDGMKMYFLDYKLIIDKDGTYNMVFFRKFTHGKWQFDDKTGTLALADETNPAASLTVRVDSISPSVLILNVTQTAMDKLIPADEPKNKGFSFFKQGAPYTFFLSADNTSYIKEKNDPYSLENNQWRIKPRVPETDEQLNNRLMSHVNFMKLLMQNVVDGKSTYFSLHSFHTPIILDAGDIRLEHYSYTRDSWDNYFYDTLQAQKAYKMLEKAVIYNGVKPANTGDRFQNSVDMLEQVLNHLNPHPLKGGL